MKATEVYSPREDTFFLLNFLRKQNFSGLNILEIGTGTGIIADFLAEKNKVSATDINPKAIVYARKHSKNAKNINFIVSDLFKNSFFRNKKFDLIIFNPPYLPQDKNDDLISTTDNGVILRFLKKAKKYLTYEGRIILVLSNLSSKINFEYIQKNYAFKIIKEKNLSFFEKLFLFLLSK